MQITAEFEPCFLLLARGGSNEDGSTLTLKGKIEDIGVFDTDIRLLELEKFSRTHLDDQKSVKEETIVFAFLMSYAIVIAKEDYKEFGDQGPSYWSM